MHTTKKAARAKPSWSAQKAALLREFPRLADSDLAFEECNKQQMLKQLEIKLALTVTELQAIMEAH